MTPISYNKCIILCYCQLLADITWPLAIYVAPLPCLHSVEE